MKILKLESMLEKFGVVNVMDVKLYKTVTTDNAWDSIGTLTATKEILDTNGDPIGVFQSDSANPLATLKTLTVSNINSEGPTKEIKGGRGSSKLMRTGKTFTFEATDVMGSYNVITNIFGGKASDNGNFLTITDAFAPNLTLIGKTQLIDKETGVKQLINIVIPNLVPNSIMNLVQQSEGDASVFDLSGTINKFSETAFKSTTGVNKYTSGGDKEYYFFAIADALDYLEYRGYKDSCEDDIDVMLPAINLLKNSAKVVAKNTLSEITDEAAKAAAQVVAQAAVDKAAGQIETLTEEEAAIINDANTTASGVTGATALSIAQAILNALD